MSLNRIKELQERMTGAGMEAAIILYSRDLFYYAGTAQPCVLLVTPKEFHLFIRRGYDFAITEVWLDKGKLSNESRLEAVSNKLKEWKVTEGSVGLEINEPPMVKEDDYSTIHNGYVLALDIHMMHPECGAVKLEDMVLITDQGAEILNVSPRELFEVER